MRHPLKSFRWDRYFTSACNRRILSCSPRSVQSDRLAAVCHINPQPGVVSQGCCASPWPVGLISSLKQGHR